MQNTLRAFDIDHINVISPRTIASVLVILSERDGEKRLPVSATKLQLVKKTEE